MRRNTFVGLLVLGMSWIGYGAECNGAPSPNALPNRHAVQTSPPRLVKEIKNAKLFTVGENGTEVDIVHLWGRTGYEMGFAHGTIAKAKVTALLNGVWAYLEAQVESAINGTVHNLKPWFAELIATVGMEAALEATLLATEGYTGSYFNDELRGMANATGVPFKRMQMIHMIGELTKGSCSMYGAWGKATESTGNLMQLRALDWDVDGPFKDYPEIVVYHPTPNTGLGHPFLNIAWSGFIGSITGMSSVKMAISEIGVTFPDSTFGKESRIGVPFTYLLRDVLQFDDSLAASEAHLHKAKRTCDLIFGIGDGKPGGGFRGVQYSASAANFMNDTTMLPVADWHPRVPDLVYYGMDWLCPNYSKVLHAQLAKVYGKITAENTISDIVPIVQTGDLHVAIYDLTQMVLHVSTARKTGGPGAQMAYDRPFFKLDATSLFSETSPTL